MKANSISARSGSFDILKNPLRTVFYCCFSLSFSVIPQLVNSQCPVGTNPVSLNWDALDYFVYTGNYIAPNYLPSNAAARIQNFQFGTQRLTISHAYPNASSFGENATHTGEAGSFGTGEDINFTGNGTITLTFESDVRNVRFSIYDLDNSQSLTVTAQNGVPAAQNILMTKANVAALHVIAGSGTFTASATSLLVGNPANNSNLGTINVEIPGPVRTVTITLGATGGDYWISDISGCITTNFPTNYYSISQPFTGQPGYVLHSFDKSVYAVNPVNGFTKLLFTDALGPGNVNSMAYDPYNKIMYYVYSLTGPGNSRVLRSYDFNTETFNTVLADINTIGIPTAQSGAESGAAGFYNGALYLGIETSNQPGRNSNREAVIWRIDFLAGVPNRASQVFATPVDDGGGTLLHDWSDFVVNNGMLYDFDGAGVTTQTDIYHFNMMTGALVNYNSPVGYTPGQPTVDWNNRIYNMHANTGAPATLPYIARYNEDGTIGARSNLFSTPMFVPANPSLGDAAEAFKPKADFGDAPATYDPVGVDPAVHERDVLLRLGPSYDYEWNGTASANADADGADEDGASPPNLNYGGTSTYSFNVSVFNNTGGNATLVGWLDYNFNNIFDVGEGRSVNVPNSAVAQSINISWNSINVLPTALLRTFVRLRVTRAANGMTTANKNGYFPDGEVEDHPVLMGTFLANEKISFSAEKRNDNEVGLKWTVSSAPTIVEFKIERSGDGTNWSQLGSVAASNSAAQQNLAYSDLNPLQGKSYYRIKLVYDNGSYRYTSVKNIEMQGAFNFITISPNPASKLATVKIGSNIMSTATITLTDYAGRSVVSRNVRIVPGENTILIPEVSNLTPGLYLVSMKVGEQVSNLKLIISRQ